MINMRTSVPSTRLSTIATPDSFGSNLKLWLRSDKGVFQDSALTIPAIENTSIVGGWADQSGNGNNFTQTILSQSPTYRRWTPTGFPAIQTTSSTSLALVTAITNTPWALFEVFALQQNQFNPARVLIHTISNGGGAVNLNFFPPFTYSFTNTNTTSLIGYETSGGAPVSASVPAWSTASPMLVTTVGNSGGTVQIAVDGQPLSASSNSGWGVISTIMYGNGVTMWLYESVLINIAPTTAQVQGLQSYFRNKYKTT
jgi:hypothetical protein